MEEEGTTDNLLTKKLKIINNEASRVSKNIEKQISKIESTGSSTEPAKEDGESAIPNKAKGQEIYEEKSPVLTFIKFVLLPVLFVFALSPIPMIALGATHFEDCSYSFYPTWLIAGGAGVLCFSLFFFLGICFCADGLTGGGFSIPGGDIFYMCSCCLLVLDFGFEIVWYFVGCYYIWGGETGKTVLEMETGVYKYDYSCRCLYYFVYTLIVLPLLLLAVFFFIISMFVLVRMIQLAREVNRPGGVQTTDD